MSVSTGLYPNLDLQNANKLHYIGIRDKLRLNTECSVMFYQDWANKSMVFENLWRQK